MTRPCATCGNTIDDHKHVRYTIRGVADWYCSPGCADQA